MHVLVCSRRSNYIIVSGAREVKVRVVRDEVRKVRGSNMRALWAMVGTVVFALNKMGAIRGF